MPGGTIAAERQERPLLTHRQILLLMGGLFVRGLGLGATMMPAMAAAYATLESAGEVPRATPMLNVLQRVGGSLGVAVLTVLLQNRIASNLGSVAGGGVIYSEATTAQPSSRCAATSACSISSMSAVSRAASPGPQPCQLDSAPSPSVTP